MIFLIFTILAGSMLSLVIRVSQGRVKGQYSMLAANYLSAVIAGSLWVGLPNVLPQGEGAGLTVCLGMVNGMFYAAGIFLMQYNVRKNGVVLPNVFSRVGGLLIPLMLSVVIFGDIPRATQLVGAVIAIGAIILINYRKDGAKVGAGIFLVLIMFSDGGATSMAKVFNEVAPAAQAGRYSLYTFFFAFLIAAGVVIWKKERPGPAELGFGALIGLPNFFATRSMVAALETVPAVIAYPMRSVGGILVVTLAGIFLFRERLEKRQWLALAGVLVALVLLNV